MRIGRILFLAIFLFCLSIILATSSLAEKIINDSFKPISLSAKGQSELKAENLSFAYKKSLLDNLQNYQSGKITGPDLEQNLMSMKVPSRYKDLHLKITGAISQINQGHKGDLSVAKNNLENLKEKYAWLTGVLTFFLANNF